MSSLIATIQEIQDANRGREMSDYLERDFYETDLSGEMEEERELRHIRRCEDLDWQQGIPPYDDED